jgi:hypothetical protein
MAWRVLSTAPRVAVAPALFDPDVCARLVAAARPYFDRPEVSSSSSSYQTRPAASCGDEVMTILRGANIIQAAENATGIAYRPGEDIVIARTSCAATPQYSNGDMHLSGTLFSSVHHDRNNAGNGGERAATFMVYLTTIAAGNGGETFFPALNSSVEEDPVARALEASYLAERRILELESSLSVKCEELLVRWRRGGGGDGDGGDGGGQGGRVWSVVQIWLVARAVLCRRRHGRQVDRVVFQGPAKTIQRDDDRAVNTKYRIFIIFSF